MNLKKQCLKYSNTPIQKINLLITEMNEKYNEKNRFYHNLKHIKKMLQILKKYRKQIKDFQSLFWAALFHDVIYDPKRHDNESESALYALLWLEKMGFSDEQKERVQTLILSTEKHIPSDSSFDSGIFLDADLAVLSSCRWHYFFYARKIRKEYSFIPDADYKEGRGKVLKSFLEKKEIYLTPEMKRYEKKARRNILSEMKGVL
ncbi:MAG TPA: hypothetical protein DHW82_14320 [Spirochaetia bacterium]|nr:MAG: hypothetical protein A2Y41_12150 [Spirochaetes bacterium GWB1_36_13]HCL58166.1 hypothetical protein [Spirochaetia bacterium]